jgi:hypothetical protein
MAPAPINCFDSGAKAIAFSRGSRGMLPGRGRRDRRGDRREDAGRLRSDRSTLCSETNPRRPARARRRALQDFASIGDGPLRTNAGASERAPRSAETLSFASRAPGRLPAPGALSGPRVLTMSKKAILARIVVVSPRVARNLFIVVGPIVPPPDLAHVGSGCFLPSPPEREGSASRCLAPQRRAAGKHRNRRANRGPHRVRECKQIVEKSVAEFGAAPSGSPLAARRVARGAWRVPAALWEGVRSALEGKKGV